MRAIGDSIGIVNSADLKPAQIAAIMERVGRDLRYLVALQERMRQLRFPHDDRLFKVTEQARDGMSRLYRELYEWDQPQRTPPTTTVS